MNALDEIFNAHNGQLVRQLGDQFGLDEGQVRDAISSLAPSLGRGVRTNVEVRGEESLLNALRNGNHARYLDDLSALTDGEAAREGDGILGHIFGSKEVSREVAARAASQTGISDSILKKMLPVLASVMMGMLGKKLLGGGGSSAPSSSGIDFSRVGTGSKSSSGGGLTDMLTNFIDSDNDGSVMDDLFNMARKFL